MIKILSIAVLCSTLINVVVSQEHASRIIDSAAVNFLSVLVGLAIALHGVVSPIIVSHYANIPSGDEGDKRRKLLNDVVEEIKDNALFSLFSYFAVLLTIFLKGIDKSLYANTIIEAYAIDFGMNVAALVYMMLSGYALYDTTISIMKLHQT